MVQEIMGIKCYGKGFTVETTEEGQKVIKTAKGVELIFNSDAQFKNAKLYYKQGYLHVEGLSAYKDNSNLFDIKGSKENDKIKIFNSDIKQIDTGCGSDTVVIVNSKVNGVNMGNNDTDRLEIFYSEMTGDKKTITTDKLFAVESEIKNCEILARESATIDTSYNNFDNNNIVTKILSFFNINGDSNKINAEQCYVYDTQLSNTKVNGEYLVLDKVQTSCNDYEINDDKEDINTVEVYVTNKSNLQDDKITTNGSIEVTDISNAKSTIMNAKDCIVINNKSNVTESEIETECLFVENKSSVTNSTVMSDEKCVDKKSRYENNTNSLTTKGY